MHTWANGQNLHFKNDGDLKSISDLYACSNSSIRSRKSSWFSTVTVITSGLKVFLLVMMNATDLPLKKLYIFDCRLLYSILLSHRFPADVFISTTMSSVSKSVYHIIPILPPLGCDRSYFSSLCRTVLSSISLIYLYSFWYAVYQFLNISLTFGSSNSLSAARPHRLSGSTSPPSNKVLKLSSASCQYLK